jgi:hypothetical protein
MYIVKKYQGEERIEKRLWKKRRKNLYRKTDHDRNAETGFKRAEKIGRDYGYNWTSREAEKDSTTFTYQRSIRFCPPFTNLTSCSRNSIGKIPTCGRVMGSTHNFSQFSKTFL